MYILYSSIDNQRFEVDRNVMEASTLLKNLLDITDITQEISLNCSARSLLFFIKLINHHHEDSTEVRSEFEKTLFTNISDKELAEMTTEVCILDSDILLNSIADEILDRIKNMTWRKMLAYFGLSDDFTRKERKFINQKPLEFAISLDSPEMTFPLSSKQKFTDIPNIFYSPLNVLLSRVIQRSDETTAFRLSSINKTLKIESDRHPIKLTDFESHTYCNIYINTLHTETIKKDMGYISALKRRKIMVSKEISLTYSGESIKDKWINECSSLNFGIPGKHQKLDVSFHLEKWINKFNPAECPYKNICYRFFNNPFDFDKIYSKLITTDLSREIEVLGTNTSFDFIQQGTIRLYKKANDPKFYRIYCDSKFTPKFKDIIKNYLNDDVTIESPYNLFKSCGVYNEKSKEYIYLLDDILPLI